MYSYLASLRNQILKISYENSLPETVLLISIILFSDRVPVKLVEIDVVEIVLLSTLFVPFRYTSIEAIVPPEL